MTGETLRQLYALQGAISKIIAENEIDPNYQESDPAPFGWHRCDYCWRLYPYKCPHVCPEEKS